MRILIDQSGYDLLNLGDIAMLQSCVTRLSGYWPDAEIMIIANAPERLAAYCPGTIAIGRTTNQLLSLGRNIASYLPLRPTHKRPISFQPRDEMEALRAADIVVAAGGGYVTDTWPWHTTRVLSLLSFAQRLGKPTAMFGQGIGPLRRKVLRLQAYAVLPKLTVLGLREAKHGYDLAMSFGVHPDAVIVTGDDALELAVGNIEPANNQALGVNVRVSGYSGVDNAMASVIGEQILELAEQFRAQIIALPVARAEEDSNVIQSMFNARRASSDIVLTDLRDPQDLIDACSKCHAIITGSYHAAVFALAQGVPTVCLTKSDYYDAKFEGLTDLFPSSSWIVSLATPDFTARLRNATEEAWRLPTSARVAAREKAVRLCGLGHAAYRQFCASAEQSLRTSKSSS